MRRAGDRTHTRSAPNARQAPAMVFQSGLAILADLIALAGNGSAEGVPLRYARAGCSFALSTNGAPMMIDENVPVTTPMNMQ